MKQKPFIYFNWISGWLAFVLVMPSIVTAQSLPATLTVNAASTITSFVPLSLFGTNLAYWISAANNNNTRATVQAAGNYFLRYPGGSSSDDYHWNRQGSLDANNHWVPSGTAFLPGYEGKETYCGTTGSNNAGTHQYSHLTDGNAATTWMSNTDTNFPNHQFIYLDLPRTNSTVNVSAVSILWGTPYATSYEVQYWTGATNTTPYKAASEASWVDFPGGNITGASGGTTVVTFTTPETTRFIRILMTASSAGGGGAYAIAEIYAFNGAAQVSTNNTNYQTQSLVITSSTDPAWTNNYLPSFDFESYMTYVRAFTPSAVPLITVNVGTGTPQEAASWVYYANTVKGYGIKYWQVGNEMDGIWETGGPFRADDYAYRFTEYYNAMTAVDPTIILTGPVVGGPNNNSNAYDGLTYIQTFLNTMQTLGKTADIGAVDYHWYAGSTTAAAALGTSSQISTFAANLTSWISAAGVSPTIPIFMSEYNVNAGTPLLMNQLPTGLWLVNWLGEFIHYFGPGGHANLWDTLNGSTDTTNNTTGDQGYLQVEAGTYQYQQRANYWAMQMMATDWAIAGDSSTHQLVSAASSAATLVSYADYWPNGTLSLIVVNKDPTNSYNTTLNIGPFVPNTTANSWTFNATNYAWETTTSPYHASPDTAPTTAVMTGISASFPVTFSPYSINVIQFTNSGIPTNTPTS
ncbi:MAG TPA: discoidin domain-containing protein, partial [bacterium]